MNSALWKDNLREIKDSIPRFISIFAIIALGVSFFVGIRAAGPSMVKTAREVYQDNNMPDGHILSTVGLNEADVDLINNQENLTWLPMQSINAVISPGEENAKVFTYNGNQSTSFFKIYEGRMVEDKDEIVLDTKYLETLNEQMDSPIQIGDRVTLDNSDNSGFTLESEEFEVVGFARTPIYIERITRSGTANVFAIISDQAVSGDIYSEAYYWVDEARAYEAYSPEYNQVIDSTVATIEEVLEDRPEIRVKELRDEVANSIQEGQQEITDGYQTLEDARIALEDAKEELQDGHVSIVEGQQQLNQGGSELESGEEEFRDGIREYHQGRLELADGRAQLNYNEKVYADGLAQYEDGLAMFNQEIASAESQLTDAQSQLNQAASEAQAGYLQLAEGQEALDAGYAQLAAGRQELLDQLGLATDGQIPPEQLLAAIEEQIDVINTFLATLEEADNGDNPDIISWINSLDTERDILIQNLEELTNIVGGLPEIDTSQQNLGDLELSGDQVAVLEQLLNTELNSTTPIDEVIQLLNKRMSELEGLENSSMNYEDITNKLSEISELESQIQEIEARLIQLQAERTNLGDVNGLLTRKDELVTENETYYQRLTELSQIINGLNSQLQNQNLTDSERMQIEEELQTYNNEQTELESVIQQNNLEINDLNNQLEQVNSIDLQISELENQLIQNQEALAATEAELNQLLEENGLGELPQGIDLEQVQSELRQLVEAVEMLQTAQATLDEQSSTLAAGWDEYYAGVAELELAQSTINQGWTELNAQRATGQEQLDSSYDSLIEGRQALDDAQSQLSEGQDDLINGKRTLDESYAAIIEGRNEFETGQQEAIEGRMDLMQGDFEYNLNRHKFESEEADALVDLEDAEADIAEARRTLDDLDEPTYMVEKRGSSSAYQSLNDNANQLDVISNIFPVFFFAIAILVTFTTIKRMASEQRNYMGTMKQLGYTNTTIIQKFVVYAGIAGVLGTIVGLVIGYSVFPGVILNAYNMLYYFDNPKIEILWDWNFIAAFIALATALIPAIFTPLNMLRTQPANLLQPEPPKSGKKLWLERVPAIWNRLSFNAKMTVRNLLRYKGRNSMTLIGVAGCTMLIVTGFGISNTISNVVDVQFNEIQTYDGMVYLSDDLNQSELDEVTQTFNNLDGVQEIMPVVQDTYDAELENGLTQPVTVTVPLGDIEEFSHYVTLRERDHQANPDAIIEGGPFITERMGELLNLPSNESFTLVNEDFDEFTIEDYTVVENYVSHYLYVNPEQYEAIFGEKPIRNAYLVNYSENSNQKQVEEAIMENDNVLTTVDLNTIEQSVGDQMGSLDLITLVLIISAASLAFVVLYNLTNINVAERIRELSTIKVLGFYNHEVSMYIFNEVLVLTFLGGIVGLVLGTVLNTFLLKTMQMTDVLFSPSISIPGYIASFIISFVFSAIVMIAMHYKLKRIDMVEALKGVD